MPLTSGSLHLTWKGTKRERNENETKRKRNFSFWFRFVFVSFFRFVLFSLFSRSQNSGSARRRDTQQARGVRLRAGGYAARALGNGLCAAAGSCTPRALLGNGSRAAAGSRVCVRAEQRLSLVRAMPFRMACGRRP